MRNLMDNFWIDVIDNFLAIINPLFPAKTPGTKGFGPVVPRGQGLPSK